MTLADYLPIALMALLGIGFALFAVFASGLISPKAPTPEKTAPYESGIVPLRDPVQRFPVRFYLVAMLFVLFDIEVVFLYPWAVHFDAFPAFLFVEMLIFIGILFLGWWYVIRKGAVDWAQE